MESNGFDEQEMQRIERIIDEAFAELRIDPRAPYARETREFIARLLFDTRANILPDPISTRTLVARVRSFGWTERINGL